MVVYTGLLPSFWQEDWDCVDFLFLFLFVFVFISFSFILFFSLMRSFFLVEIQIDGLGPCYEYMYFFFDL